MGSNIEPVANLHRGVDRLSDLGVVVRVSQVYASKAIGPEGQPDFLNAAVLLETALPLEEVRHRLRRIEAELGRVRSANRFAPRPIDLDLILFDEVVIRDAELRLPDPELLDRAYLAVTIAELDPGLAHPVTGETLAEIAGRLRAGAALTPRPDVRLADGAGGP